MDFNGHTEEDKPMNKIKEALEAGKAMYCATNDEARRLFEVMGWSVNQDSNYEGLCYWASDVWGDGWDCEDNMEDAERKREIVEFSTLTRSRLAEVLGVEDDVPFRFRDKTYKIDEHGVLRKQSYCQNSGGTHWTNTRATHVCNLINHPEEITPCPMWSEGTIKDAQAAIRLFGEDATVERERHFPGIVGIATEDEYYALDGDLFKELKEGQTVKLSEIK